ncbi:MAG: hypothetical protein AAF411_19490 [Myxococcota bacterium]
MIVVRRVALLLLIACDTCGGGGEAEPQASEAETESEQAETVAEFVPRAGTVRGIVRLKEDAELPSFAPGDIHGPQTMSPWTDNCPTFEDSMRQTVSLGEGRGLEGVWIYTGSEDTDAFFNAIGREYEPQAHEVAIDACLLSRGALSVTRGDTIRLTQNTRVENFLPALAGETFSDALPFGETREYTVERGGLTVLSCAFGAPCGRTDIVVHYHPVHTVSTADGRFEMTNVPAGQTIEVVAAHPLFRYARGQIRVDEGGEATIELELEPKPPEPPPAAQAEPSELI